MACACHLLLTFLGAGRLLSLIFFAFGLCNASAQMLVLPGDYPDPSVVKSGDTFWATATTSNWAPAFPLLKSKDLLHWELEGHVFPELPSWADYYFWAPEISEDKGKFYVYYSAHKKGGSLCVGAAIADQPEGPYKDLGPLVCQEVGSIDAWPMRDEDGKLYLIWKEDGNSVKKPTPIWAQEMDESRSRLIGEKKELFRNDEPWEENLVEGVSMIKHGNYIYAFYSASGCCGRGCSYKTGVARARDLLGPWEKYDKNPLDVAGDDWKCAGHGTPVEKDGKFYFLYHAYGRESNVYAGRQGILSEFKFTDDGWVEFVNSKSELNIQPEVSDNFQADSLSPYWHWSVFSTPEYTQRNGTLALKANSSKPGAYLGTRTLSGDYHAEVTLHVAKSDAEAGLALIGDEKNFVSVTYDNGKLIFRKVEADKETILREERIPKTKQLHLRITVRNGKDINFQFSGDGKSYKNSGGGPVDGFFLPPWDRAIRVALVSKGSASESAVFDNFLLKNL